MTSRLHAAGLLILSAFLITCGGNRTVDSQSGDGDRGPAEKFSDHVFALDFGQTATIESENLSVTFTSIIQDSRCASDVVCIWEGVAIVGLQVVKLPADSHFVSVSLPGGCDGACSTSAPPRDTLGYRFQMLSLDPYPVSTIPTADEDYTATLAVFPYPPQDSVEGEVIISNQLPAVIQDARFLLDSVRIQGDIITLTVEYSGGCNDHEFELHMSPAAFMESLPVQANLYLRHVDFDDPCDAWFRRSFSFDLRPIAQLHEISYGGLDCIALNVCDFMDGTDPVRKTTVIYHPDGAPPTTWCSPQEL